MARTYLMIERGGKLHRQRWRPHYSSQTLLKAMRRSKLSVADQREAMLQGWSRGLISWAAMVTTIAATSGVSLIREALQAPSRVRVLGLEDTYGQ